MSDDDVGHALHEERSRNPVGRDTESRVPRVEHGSSEDNLGRISAELLSQVTDINCIRDELDNVNKSFESFKEDYR